MDSKTLPKGCHPGKGCFNCPYPDCINPDGSRLSEEEKAMLECGSRTSKAQEYNRAYYQKHRQEILEARRKRRQEILDEQEKASRMEGLHGQQDFSKRMSSRQRVL